VEILGAEAPGRRLFPPGSQEALINALRATLDRRDIEAQGASTLRDHVMRNYRWEEAVDALEQAYFAAKKARRQPTP
jgi:glycosyltransferase involved in cell wall biosynthesis